MHRLIFHLGWLYIVLNFPGDVMGPQGLSPSEQELYFDPEIEEGDTCVDDDGSEVFTNTARG